MSRILLVEDNPADAILVREALATAGVRHAVEVAGDGEVALDALRRDGPFPALVLLDLNLPRMDGREVLRVMRGDDALRAIPVIVLTTSSAPPDVDQAYANGANAYVRKPLGLDALITVVEAIRDFWLLTATLPDPRR